MTKWIVILLIVSGISNMIADVLLVSGKTHKKNQTKFESVQNTPMKHIQISGILGMISIMFWVLPLYYLKTLDTFAGLLAMISFVMYIMSIQTFHVVCAYVMTCYKLNDVAATLSSKSVKIYGLVCIVLSLIYTGSMIYLSWTNIIVMNGLQIALLPIFTMIFFQVVLMKALNKIPHYASVAGTLGMIVSLLGTVSVFV